MPARCVYTWLMLAIRLATIDSRPISDKDEDEDEDKDKVIVNQQMFSNTSVLAVLKKNTPTHIRPG